MNLENIILKAFKEFEGEEVKDLDLTVVIDDSWEEEHSCVVMETGDNGKVWNVDCTSDGNVTTTYLL